MENNSVDSDDIDTIINNPIYTTIAEYGDINNLMFDSAVKIVIDFIIENDCIIYGGTAINYALKLKGSFIYSDTKRPDFDFYSDNNVNLGYMLADKLIKHNFPRVKAVAAIHASTMKIFIDDIISVADISFIPTVIYSKLPTIKYEKFRVIDPIFQRLDLHIALYTPLYGKPLENINHRCRKDIKRFNLLDQFYPVGSYIDKVVDNRTKKTAKCGNVVFGGFVAYALLYETVKNPPETIIPLKCKIVDNSVDNSVEIVIPDFSFINIIAAEPVSGVEYNPYLGVRGSTFIKGDLQTEVDKYGISIVEIGKHKITCVEKILSYFLMEYFLSNNGIYLKFYQSLIDMVNFSDSDLFYLSNKVEFNCESEAYLKLRKNYIKVLNKEPKDNTLPKPYYSDKGKPDDYDYCNEIFKLDGLKKT